MVNVRAVLTTFVEVAGIALIAAGGWLVLPAAGLILAGLGLVLIGWRLA